eukprot:SAG31_NODE_238_length_19470_cov_8.921532_10_plen_203_part_00
MRRCSIIFGTVALEAFFFDDGFPRCLPADNGYPNCGAWIGHFEQCAGLADADRRRLAAETGNFSENLTAMGPTVNNFPCPGNIDGYGSPDNNYVIGSVASCDICIQSHFSSLPDSEESIEEVWNKQNLHACTAFSVCQWLWSQIRPTCSLSLTWHQDDETVEWKKIITTAVMVSVIMLPADRIFVTMFEKVRDLARPDHSDI